MEIDSNGQGLARPLSCWWHVPYKSTSVSVTLVSHQSDSVFPVQKKYSEQCQQVSFVWDYSIGILLIWFDQSNWESFFFWLNSRNWWWLQFFTFRLWWCVRVLINEDEKGWWTEVKASKCARLKPHHKSLIDDIFLLTSLKTQPSATEANISFWRNGKFKAKGNI